MADSVTSQVQQNMTFWHGIARDHLARVEAFGGELQKAQAEGAAQAQRATDEGAKLAHAWFEYGATLTRELQTLALEGAKRGLDLLRPAV